MKRLVCLSLAACLGCVDFELVEERVCLERPDLCDGGVATGGGIGGGSGGGGAGGGSGGGGGGLSDAGTLRFTRLDGGALISRASLGSTLPGTSLSAEVLLVNDTQAPTGAVVFTAFEEDGGPSMRFNVIPGACSAGVAPGASCQATVGFSAPRELNRNTAANGMITAQSAAGEATLLLSGTSFNPDAGTLLISWVDAGVGSRVWLDSAGQIATCDSPLPCAIDLPRGVLTRRTIYPERGVGITSPTTSVSSVTFAATTAEQTFSVALERANLAFVTTASVDPIELALSADLAGLTETICNGAARDAGLPGTYRAWISRTGVNQNAGLVDAGAQGWVRMDGLPHFADSTEAASVYGILYPARFDEHGARSSTPYVYGSVGNCTAADAGNYQAAQPTGGFVTSGVPCSVPAHLLCLGVDRRARTFADAPPGARRAFHTSTLTPGNRGDAGVAGLDLVCQQAAANALLFGDFLAFVATPGASALSRFDAGAPWVRLDGPLLIDPAIDATQPGYEYLVPLDRDADGTTSFTGSGSTVWTGAPAPGIACDGGSDCCRGWSNGTGSGVVGSRITTILWSSVSTSCGQQAGLSCFER